MLLKDPHAPKKNSASVGAMFCKFQLDLGGILHFFYILTHFTYIDHIYDTEEH